MSVIIFHVVVRYEYKNETINHDYFISFLFQIHNQFKCLFFEQGGRLLHALYLILGSGVLNFFFLTNFSYFYITHP